MAGRKQKVAISFLIDFLFSNSTGERVNVRVNVTEKMKEVH